MLNNAFGQDNGNNQLHSNRRRDSTDSSTLCSSIIENLLTEYLISLPSSLDEFYKVMGEIYVSEILKQYPAFKSPIELMRETLLGRSSSENAPGNTRILNALIQNILHQRQAQSNEPSTVQQESGTARHQEQVQANRQNALYVKAQNAGKQKDAANSGRSKEAGEVPASLLRIGRRLHPTESSRLRADHQR